MAPTSAEADIGALPCHGQWSGFEVDDDKGPPSSLERADEWSDDDHEKLRGIAKWFPKTRVTSPSVLEGSAVGMFGFLEQSDFFLGVGGFFEVKASGRLDVYTQGSRGSTAEATPKSQN